MWGKFQFVHILANIVYSYLKIINHLPKCIEVDICGSWCMVLVIIA